MNKRIDFTHLGGFPATQYMTNFMQESYRDCFMAIANIIGDKVIVQGCDIIGGQVTNGWISVAGELIPFVGGVLPAGASVAISEAPASRVFDNGATRDVYFTKTATIGSPGSFLFSDLKRVSVYKDLFDSFTNLLNAFNTHTHSWASITGKPANNIKYVGAHWIGDIDNDNLITITHNQNFAGNYTVVGNLVSYYDWNSDNDAICVLFNKLANSFQLATRQLSGTFQQIQFEYIIIQ
jgi:hypothetical protein